MRSPQKEHAHLSAVHPVVPGESVLFLGETSDGIISLSNYRLYVSNPPGPGFLNIPLGLIETLEQRDLFFVQIYCKDGRCYRIQFNNTTSCDDWLRRIMNEIAPPGKIEDLFSFSHFAWACEEAFEELSSNLSNAEMSGDFTWFRSELARLRFDLQGAWRVSMINQDHKLCSSYPQEILVPASISDSVLDKVAQFRSQKRIPAIVWRNTANGAVLARCSQPEVGWLGWRSSEDEELVRALAEACAYDSGTTSRHSSGSDISSSSYEQSSTNGEIPSLKDLSAEAAARGEVRKVLIVDARSFAAATANRARGGGVECREYYPNAEIQFMNLANIHSIRKSFQSLRSLCHSPPDQTSWFQALDSTKWLHHMSGLLQASVRCVTALQTEGRAVIVHCSDGWDRTPQLVALSQLLLDPYYRTLEGFQVLVEKEWLDFGHKMADRCGQGMGCADVNERSPIFLQWLDCVHQLLLQFPCHFEFNLTYLLKLAQHTYSNLFGNFLTNSLAERRKLKIKERTRSIWGYLRNHPTKFRNFLFVRRDEVLWPRFEVRDLLVWQDVYMGDAGNSSSEVVKDVSSQETGSDNGQEISDDTDKSQNGSKESTPDVCPEFRQNLSNSQSTDENSETVHVSNKTETDNDSNGVDEIVTNGTSRLERKTNQIESSTDTLVPDLDNQMKIKRSAVINVPPIRSQFTFEDQFASLYSDSEPLDSDGLVSHHNHLQQRMVQIFSCHQAEVNALRRDLHMSRLALTQAGIKPETILTTEDIQDQFVDGRSGVESTTSEVSWEAVDDADTQRPTLWIPDHAASSCMGCNTQFWFGRRKHHCRSCGRLFCSECSERTVPLPAEQLYTPVRVCDNCYSTITGQSQRNSDVIDKCDTNIDNTDISSDKALDVVATLNRNGTNLSNDQRQPANSKDDVIDDEISDDTSENFRIERDSSKSCNGEVSEVNNATNSRNSVELKVN